MNSQQTKTQMEAQHRFSKIRQRAAQIAVSLLSEGYMMVSQSNACETVILRHRSNGNHMTIRCGELGVYVWKNQLLKKIELL